LGERCRRIRLDALGRLLWNGGVKSQQAFPRYHISAAEAAAE